MAQPKMNIRPSLASTSGLGPQAKRRKVRRGTRSCWECKRRKVRCSFSSSEGEICIACRRRGAKCINQELPEEHSRAENSAEPFASRTGSASQIPANVRHNGISNNDPVVLDRGGEHRIEFPTPASTSNEGTSQITAISPSSRRNSSTYQRPRYVENSWVNTENYKTISETLHAAFPSQKDLNILCNAEYKPAIYFYQVSLKSCKHLEQEGFECAATMKEKPSPGTHPVLLAKRMLILAIFLYNLIPQASHGLSEHPRVMMKRLANTAIRLVATNDELSGTMEYLECQMLEGSYHWYCGNLRRAYLSWRRALVLAQVMGIHRPSPPPVKRITPGTASSPQFVWFRVVYMDRFFSLMLRLPQGTSDASVGCDAALVDATPNERLEREHAMIAGHIIERNEHDPHLKDSSMTQNIDAELLQAANRLPAQFWSHPNLTDVEMKSKGAFQEIIRQVDQIFHYTMISLLHLPNLLRFNIERKHEYSRMSCVNASREILIRLGTFNNYDAVTTYCRPAHFFALMGAVTLLLAHINNRQSQEATNLLAHQRLSDHAMVEQVVEKMTLVGRLSEDPLLEKSAVLLRRLLDAEEDSAQGRNYTLQSMGTNEDDLEDELNVRDELQITLPYFGSIQLIRKASEAMEVVENRTCPNTPPTRNQNIQCASPNNAYQNNIERLPGVISSPQHTNNLSEPSPTLERPVEQMQSLSVDSTIDLENGIFGDIDTAFFENLMNSINVPGAGAIDGNTEAWDFGYGELFGNE